MGKGGIYIDHIDTELSGSADAISHKLLNPQMGAWSAGFFFQLSIKKNVFYNA